MFTSKNLLILPLCIALLIASAFFILLTTAGDGRISVAEPDQVLYMQYARNMATGQPYVFSSGDEPSSGSTTHLYIFILSVLYKLGATGEAFLAASYILNATFLLGIVAMVWLIVRKLHPASLPLAMFMTVLSGHTVSAVLKQTDIGLFMVLALGLFAALLYSRYILAIILALFCAAARPEGFVFAVSFLSCGILSLILNARSHPVVLGTRKQSLWFIACGIVGVLIFAIILFINHATTGYWQFMSVANKGYFKVYPFSGAVQHTLQDALSLIKGVFFGLHETYRQYYLFPALSGILGIGGIMLYHRENPKVRLCEGWVALSAGAVIFLVASSEFQGLSNDRYLGWLFPIWIIYVTIGWDEISNRIKAPHFRSICAALLLLYQFVSLAHVASSSYTTAIAMEQQRGLATQIQETLEPSARFGTTASSGIHFFMPERKVYNLHGVTSPDFFSKEIREMQQIIERVKHEPDLQFDYWISTEKFLDGAPWIQPMVGPLAIQDKDTALTSEDAYGIYPADWSTLNGGDTPQLVDEEIGPRTLIGRLDVGYVPDEEKHDYTYTLRLKSHVLPLIAKTDRLTDHDYSEAGRIILGSETFTILDAELGKPVFMVLRTGTQADGTVYFGAQYSSINKLELNETLNFRLFVDGTEAPCPPVNLRKEGFSEVVITLPGAFITTPNPTITLAGDHISYAYWFYQ